MTKLSVQFTEEMNQVVEGIVGMTFTPDTLKNMSQEEMTLLQSILRMLDAYCKLVEEQGKMMDEMNEKLDKLLKERELA